MMLSYDNAPSRFAESIGSLLCFEVSAAAFEAF